MLKVVIKVLYFYFYFSGGVIIRFLKVKEKGKEEFLKAGMFFFKKAKNNMFRTFF